MANRLFALVMLFSFSVNAETLTVTVSKELDFGEHFAGDASEAVTTANGATLLVTNNSTGTQFVQISLLSTSVGMVEPNSGQSVTCSSINSNPASGSFFALGAGASRTIQIGGTRAALSSTQAAGFYSGGFTFRATSFFPTVSVDTTVNAKFRVLPSIAITKIRDLNFGGGAANDLAKTVAPTSGSSARFKVTGGTGKLFSISLPPATSSSPMITGGGGAANKTIQVTSYVSSPSGTGTLDNVLGEATIDVGATRAAILSNQVQGAYSGSFTVTVTYQ